MFSFRLIVMFSLLAATTAVAEDFSLVCERAGSYQYSSAADSDGNDLGTSWSGEELNRKKANSETTINLIFDGGGSILMDGETFAIHIKNDESVVWFRESKFDRGANHTFTIITYALNIRTNKLVSSFTNSFFIAKENTMGVNAGASAFECESTTNDVEASE